MGTAEEAGIPGCSDHARLPNPESLYSGRGDVALSKQELGRDHSRGGLVPGPQSGSTAVSGPSLTPKPLSLLLSSHNASLKSMSPTSIFETGSTELSGPVLVSTSCLSSAQHLNSPTLLSLSSVNVNVNNRFPSPDSPMRPAAQADTALVADGRQACVQAFAAAPKSMQRADWCLADYAIVKKLYKGSYVAIYKVCLVTQHAEWPGPLPIMLYHA